MKTVLVFGSFDPLHEGHRSYFRQARDYGDRLVCVVARDATIRSVKQHKPFQGESERLRAVRACAAIDEAILGSTANVYDVLSEVQPDVVCLGYDQRSFIEQLPDELRRRGLSARIVRLQSFHPERYKSSLLKEAKA